MSNLGPLFAHTPKLKPQAVAILERLQQGPVWNVELNQIAFRYGGRIHELRRAGYEIEIIDRGEHGRRLYALKGV